MDIMLIANTIAFDLFADTIIALFVLSLLEILLIVIFYFIAKLLYF